MSTPRFPTLFVLCGVLLARPLVLYAADRENLPGAAGRPWADNVSQDRQDQALHLYEEANKLFEDSQHAAALAKYREALQAWDHPAIRYNAAVALIHLDQPLAAYENLEAALRYGTPPFSGETYQQALTYQKLLRGQLAELEASCAEPGADVALDGVQLFVGPGKATRRLLPGPHQLVARKVGYLTETRSLTLLPGMPSSETLRLQDIRTLPTKTVRRWPVWKPLAVIGAGVLVAAIGVPFSLAARSDFNTYDAWTADMCGKTPEGCKPQTVPPSWAADAQRHGRTENAVAISLFGLGGAVAATGVVLLLLDQPRVVRAEETAHARVLPVIGPGSAGVSIAILR